MMHNNKVQAHLHGIHQGFEQVTYRATIQGPRHARVEQSRKRCRQLGLSSCMDW